MPFADVAAVIKNAVNGMDMAVKNKGAILQSAGPLRNVRRAGCDGSKRKQYSERNIIEYFHE